MKDKKIIMYASIILIILIVLSVGYFIYNKINNKKNEIEEFIPEEEFSDENLRQTVVDLYFLNPNNYELEIEQRKIDAKELIENPYKKLIYLLIEGPKNQNLLKLIPEDAVLNNIKLEDGILYVDFSEGLIQSQNLGKEQEEMIIKSIVNTLSQFTEVNKIKILIDGEENKGFPDGELTFDNIFVKD